MMAARKHGVVALPPSGFLYTIRASNAAARPTQHKKGTQMVTTESQAPIANPAAIAAILNDTRDEPLRNKDTRIALEILKLVPDLSSPPCEIMLTSLARYAGNTYVACSSSTATVLFMGKHAFILARDDGLSVPWVSTDKLNVPDMGFFKCRVRVNDGLSAHLLLYIKTLMQAERMAADAALALAHAAADDECDAPAP
jgi:hypothetical protein